MGSKTRIVILRMKEIIYTVVFIILAVCMIFFLIFMFSHNKGADTSDQSSAATYVPGVYTTSIMLGDEQVDLQVTVDENHINGVTIQPLEESITTMYPLLGSCLENISSQLADGIPLSEVTTDESSQYTASVLLEAIDQALEKAVK